MTLGVSLKKFAGLLPFVFSGLAYANEPTEADLLAYSKRIMYKNDDISTIELSKMYGGADRKMMILPISGTIWRDVMMNMPDGYIRSISGHFNSRPDKEEIIQNIDKIYQTSNFESANTLVTRSNGYKFCLVDDGLRKEFESKAGFLRVFFAGVLPVYFEREDVFLFMRHHEASHCLDDESNDQSPEQKVISTMMHESAADLTATLVYANRFGNYDIFYNVIRPMRMANSMDIEHTTEDIVEHMISDIPPDRLRDVEFSKILKLRNLLVSQMETKESLNIMIKNAYEKQVVSLYLKKKIEENGTHQSPQVNQMLDGNTETLNKLVTKQIYDSVDIDARFDAMVGASLDNIEHYKSHLSMRDEDLKNFGTFAVSLGLNLRPGTIARLKNLYK